MQNKSSQRKKLLLKI